jgi:hypothetical protein
MLGTLFPRRRLKVFGLGLSKTGTTTLSACLRELGYKHTGYDPDLLNSWSRGQTDRIWRTIDKHDSFEDWPYPLMFAEIMERFGRNAYYILTRRKDAPTWLESLKKHAMRQPLDRVNQRRIAYGIDYPHLNETVMLDRYEQHNAAVTATAAKLGLSDRLRVLCWEDGDGWKELCSFLDRPAPVRPFPHENRATPPDATTLAENLRIAEELKSAKPSMAVPQESP